MDLVLAMQTPCQNGILTKRRNLWISFQAADILRLLGIGRNEYIALMNKGKAKKLMWRVNKSSILREMLPTEPIDIQFQPWWIVCIVNLGDLQILL